MFIVVVDKRFMIRKKKVAGRLGGGGGKGGDGRGRRGATQSTHYTVPFISGRKGAVGMYEDYKHED